MRIILAPAKNMQLVEDSPYELSKPQFLAKTQILLDKLKRLSFDELKKVYKVSDEIVLQNMERLKITDLEKNLSPACLSYNGIAFKHLSANVFSDEEYDYLNKHLRILSGFYGALRPFDGIVQYRLEMQSQIASLNLYDFWQDDIYQELKDDVIINLASKEYSKCIEDYLEYNVRYINIHFVEKKKDKYVVKATYAKMARGEMLRFMTTNKIEDVEDLKKFNCLNYKYLDLKSDDNNFYFERIL